MENGEEFISDFTKPEPPSAADCCNSGCSPCVFDLYEINLAKWKNRDVVNKHNSEIRHDLLSETKFKPFVLLEKYLVANNVFCFKFQPCLFTSKDDLSHHSHEIVQNISGILPYSPGQHFIIKNVKKLLNESSDENQIDCNLDEQRNFMCDQNSKFDSDDNVKFIEEKLNSRSIKNIFITRAYTPISLSKDESNCVFSMIIKLYENGAMSNFLSTLSVGNITYFRGPYGNFHYVPNSYKKILMICMGTGIAPMYTIIKDILNNDMDLTVIKLLYGCRSADDILLRDELRNFALFWNFSVDFFLTNDNSDTVVKFGENFIYRRIDDARVLEKLSNKNDQLILICGSDQFNESVLSSILKFGISKENVHLF